MHPLLTAVLSLFVFLAFLPTFLLIVLFAGCVTSNNEGTSACVASSFVVALTAVDQVLDNQMGNISKIFVMLSTIQTVVTDFTVLILVVIVLLNWSEVKVATSAFKEFSFVAGSAVKDFAFKIIDALFSIDVFGFLGRTIDSTFDNLVKLNVQTTTALICAVVVTTALLNWGETKIVTIAVWGEVASATIPVWLALEKAVPEVWDTVSNPVTLLNLVAFVGLVRTLDMLVDVVAGTAGKVPHVTIAATAATAALPLQVVMLVTSPVASVAAGTAPVALAPTAAA